MRRPLTADRTSADDGAMQTAAIADRIAWAMDGLAVEIPTWGFVNTGTRFRVFPQAGVPRDVTEKLADAGTVARYTGIAKRVAIHIPWDRTDDWGGLRSAAAAHGLAIGAVNSNTFQDEDYRLGSLCSPFPAVRAKAVAHVVECCAIVAATGSDVLKVWLADGTNYPGQDDLRARRHRLVATLTEIYAALPPDARLVLEYKLFEPAFYATDVADWGQAVTVVRRLGDRASVCLDIGHHAMSVNIEQIVAALLAEGRLGGFDLNDKQYGDDDLMVGSIDPYRLFRICHEMVSAMRDDADPLAQRCARETVWMLDQCHNIEPKLPAIVRSVMNLQEAVAKALLVDREALLGAQLAGDVLGANAILVDAYSTDVRPALAELRTARGLPADPFRAYLASGEEERRAETRVGGTAASW